MDRPRAGVTPYLHPMRALETRIPPPIVMVLAGAIGWLASRCLPALSLPLPFNKVLVISLATAGIALNLLPKLAFARVSTTVNPLRPASSTCLVTSGIYRYTRNPMYLGHSVILLAWAVFLHNAAAFSTVPVFMLYISRFQIQPEEKHLAVRFPGAYAAFRQRTPRWL